MADMIQVPYITLNIMGYKYKKKYGSLEGTFNK